MENNNQDFNPLEQALINSEEETAMNTDNQLLAQAEAFFAQQNKGGNVFEFGGKVYYDDQAVTAFGRKMTIEDVREVTRQLGALNVVDENKQMELMAKRNKLQFIVQQTDLERQVEKFAKQVGSASHSENLDFQNTQAQARKLSAERDNGNIVNGTLDIFDNEVQRDNFIRWSQSIQLKIVAVGVNENGFPNVTLQNVTPSQQKAIKWYMRDNKLNLTTKKVIKKTEQVLSKSTKFTIDSLITPLSKSAVSFSGSVIGTTTKAVTEVGGQIVNSAVDEKERITYEMHQDADLQRAKMRLGNGMGKVKSLFGGGTNKMNGWNLQ